MNPSSHGGPIPGGGTSRGPTPDPVVRRAIVVTGASAGLGRATVRRLARDGHRIALVARGRAGLEAAAAEVRAAGGTALVLVCDVADAEALDDAATRAERELGPIDVWINCAMSTVQGRVVDTAAADIRRATEVTYLGSVHGLQSALRRMVPRDRGHVVQIGSALGTRAAPTQAAYSGAKHAIRGFCDAAAAELRHDGSRVRISLLLPPAMNTTHFGWVRTSTRGAPRPFPPLAQPEGVAEQIAWAIERPGRSRIVLDLASVLAVPFGRTDVPVLGPVVAALLAAGLQTRAARRPGPDNLRAPLDDLEDHGARGTFDREARTRIPEARLLRRPVASMVGGLAGVGGAAALVRRARAVRRR